MSTWIDLIRARTLRRRALALVKAKDFAEALSLSQRAVELAPDSAVGWRVLTLALLGLQRYAEAIEASDTAIELQPQYTPAWSLKAMALYRLRRTEEALAAYDVACSFDPNAYLKAARGMHLQRLDALLDLKHYDHALMATETLVARVPDDSMLWAKRGLIFTKLNRHAEAEAAFIRADMLAASDEIATAKLGAYYAYHVKDNGRAMAICDAMDVRWPDHATTWALRAEVLLHHKDYRLASYAYEQALARSDATMEKFVERALFLNNYGIALMHQGRYADALAAYDKSEALLPGRAAIPNNRGIVFSRIERYTDALNWYEAADNASGVHVRGPVNIWAETRNNSAYALALLGQRDQARAILNDVFAVEPRNGFTWGVAGMLETAAGHMEDALAAFTTSLEIEPDYAPTYASYAQLLTMLDDTAQALRMSERSLSLDAYDTRTWKIHAQVLRAGGREVDAAKAEQHGATLLAEQLAQVDAYLRAKERSG